MNKWLAEGRKTDERKNGKRRFWPLRLPLDGLWCKMMSCDIDGEPFEGKPCACSERINKWSRQTTSWEQRVSAENPPQGSEDITLSVELSRWVCSIKLFAHWKHSSRSLKLSSLEGFDFHCSLMPKSSRPAMNVKWALFAFVLCSSALRSQSEAHKPNRNVKPKLMLQSFCSRS